MAFWISLRDQLLALWNRWTIGQRTGFAAAAIACFAAVLGTIIWASQPDYVVIASQLTPSRSAEIVGVLDTEKIGYKLNFSSSAVSVASSDVATARLALKDVMNPEELAESGGDSMFPFPSPRAEEDQRRNALEKRVERSLTQIQGVRAATVSVSRPDQSPFAVDQSPVTAAVVIQPVAGAQISSATAQTIITVVARSVPGLTSDNIVLTDTTGRQFGSHEGIGSELATQLEYRHRLEADLAHHAESLLAAAQGVRAKVRVTAEIDFSKQTRLLNTFDPDAKAKRSEQINTTKQDGGVALPVGVPGTATNVNIAPDANTKSPSGPGKYQNEQITTEYDSSFVNEQIEKLPGNIQRLTVAAIVDVQPATVTAADQNTPGKTAAAPFDQQQIENIIKTAVGFDSERNDEVNVILAPLAPETADDPIMTGFVWEQWQPLIQSMSLGLAATLTFLIGAMLIKRMKPIVITETVGPGIPLADARRLAAITEQAKANPEIVANILSAWLSEQEQATSPPSTVAVSSGVSNGVKESPAVNAQVPKSQQGNPPREKRSAA